MNVGIKIAIIHPFGNQIIQIQVPVVSSMLSRQQYLRSYAQVLSGLSQQMFVNGLAAVVPILLEIQGPLTPNFQDEPPASAFLQPILDMVQMNTLMGSALPDVFKTHKDKPWLKTQGEIRKVDGRSLHISLWRRFGESEIIETSQCNLQGWIMLYPELFFGKDPKVESQNSAGQDDEETEPRNGEENSGNGKEEGVIRKEGEPGDPGNSDRNPG